MKLIGGLGKTVEIDEKKFSTRKYTTGILVDGVLGGICRERNECILVPASSRDWATLIPILFGKIAPGTSIMSNYWKV